MNNEELMLENSALRKIVQELTQENKRLKRKLHNIELYINEYEGADVK